MTFQEYPLMIALRGISTVKLKCGANEGLTFDYLSPVDFKGICDIVIFNIERVTNKGIYDAIGYQF